MITQAHVATMARYNQWQNRNLYGCADQLPDDERKRDRGAFWKSIHGTLCHNLYGDLAWLNRFAGTPVPKLASFAESATWIDDWSELKSERVRFDEVLIDWADRLDPAWLDGDLTWYSGVAGRELTKSKWLLVTHLFNHETHHRGQVHAMLTAAGQKPDDTDLVFMPA